MHGLRAGAPATPEPSSSCDTKSKDTRMVTAPRSTAITSSMTLARPGGRLITAVTGLHRDTELAPPVGRRADDGQELSVIARESDEAIMGADVVN